jgi:excisionase family DNA binding protein
MALNMKAPNSDKKEQTAQLSRLAYSMRETADILGVSYITVHRLIKRGKLRSCSALRHKLIPATEIERFLKSTLE